MLNIQNIIIKDGVLPVHFSALRASCGLAELRPEMVERGLRASLISLSAMNGPRAVGMVRVVGDGAFAFVVYDLLVTPAWRRQGIGTLLVREALQRIASFHPPGDYVTVGLFCAQGRESFYSRLGFREMNGNELGTGMQKIFKAEEIV